MTNPIRKGKRFERELANLFRDAFPGVEVKRGLQGRGGTEVPDVVVPHWHVEAKRGRKPNIRAALAQAIGDADSIGEGKMPIAVIRDDRSEAIVAMRLEDFMTMAKAFARGDT